MTILEQGQQLIRERQLESEPPHFALHVPNQVVQLRDGWYALVAGRFFGPWPVKGYAVAGLAVEQRRHAAALYQLASASARLVPLPSTGARGF